MYYIVAYIPHNAEDMLQIRTTSYLAKFRLHQKTAIMSSFWPAYSFTKYALLAISLEIYNRVKAHNARLDRRSTWLEDRESTGCVCSGFRDVKRRHNKRIWRLFLCQSAPRLAWRDTRLFYSELILFRDILRVAMYLTWNSSFSREAIFSRL